MNKGPKSSDELLAIIRTISVKKGFYLNRDETFVKDLVDGLYENLKRYGYASCPCRLSSGNYEADKDILCPCVYMKEDVDKYGVCFCALYVSKDVFEGRKEPHSIPESRPRDKTFSVIAENKDSADLWKCSVCGYEHKGEEPPGKCPICEAGKEFFVKK